jgi:hypothetical protein
MVSVLLPGIDVRMAFHVTERESFARTVGICREPFNGPQYVSEVHSASNRNKYQKFFLGVGARKADNVTICKPIVKTMWYPQYLITL